MFPDIDVTIIGAGVVGLAVASSVSGEGRSVVVIERHDSFGQETSSRNSEVIHSGIYYPKGSLKAESCIQGKELLYEICEKNGIRHKRIGKIVIACDDSETSALEKLYQNGINNGVRIGLIDGKKINKLEPNIKGILGIYSPSTGIIDSHGLMKYFAAKTCNNGGQIVYGTSAQEISKITNGWKVSILEPSSSLFSFETKVLINCAGLESDRIAEMAGMDIDAVGYRLKMCKGVYFKVTGNSRQYISRLVYPVPNRSHGVLGIHATIDMGGQLKLGPDSEYMNGQPLDYSVDERKKDIFCRSVKPFLPFIKIEDLSPDTAGIRPKLHGPDESFKDFVIAHEDKRGFSGLINLIGIESPGLTASPYIGRYVAKLIKGIM